MSRRRTVRAALITAMLPALTAGAALAAAQSAAPAGNAARGRSLFFTEGCYACHGTTGIGTTVAPRLAPEPLPWLAFIYQMRQRRGAERWVERVPSDAQAADIYAYLASIRPAPPAAHIPLLNEP